MVLLKRPSQTKTIEILVKGTQMQREENNMQPLLLMKEWTTKNGNNVHRISYAHRCNAHWSLNTCADYITQFMRSYHVYSNNLIELCIWKEFFFFLIFLDIKMNGVYWIWSTCVSALWFFYSNGSVFVVQNVDHYCFACYYWWFE